MNQSKSLEQSSIPKKLKRTATKKQIKRMRRLGDDTIVQCEYCGRTQYLKFVNGLRNGWSRCCHGLTMPIIYHEADVEKAVKEIFEVSE